MSGETKKQMNEVHETIKRIKTAADDAVKKVEKLDRNLGDKLKKISVQADEASKHITERSGQ